VHHLQGPLAAGAAGPRRGQPDAAGGQQPGRAGGAGWLRHHLLRRLLYRRSVRREGPGGQRHRRDGAGAAVRSGPAGAYSRCLGRIPRSPAEPVRSAEDPGWFAGVLIHVHPAQHPPRRRFAMPAEWAPHSQTWMLWPERPDNWREAGAPAQRAFAEVARAIAGFEPVTVGVSAAQYARASDLLDHPAIRVVELSSDDAWVRDTGPTFVTNGQGGLRGVDWEFNAWGGLNGGLYAPWDRDDQVADKILGLERCPRYRTEGFVLEGGAIHVDGEGTLITTEECLLNPNRNPHLQRHEIEQMLREYLAVECIIWLPEGLYN